MSASAVVFALAGAVGLASLTMRRRRFLPYWIAAIGSGLIGLLILYVPIETPISLAGLSLKLESAWQILGRSILLNDRNRAAVSFLFLSGAVFFACGSIARPGRSFRRWAC